MTRKRTYTFAGNDKRGLIRSIRVQSISLTGAELSAKQQLTNPRLIKVG